MWAVSFDTEQRKKAGQAGFDVQKEKSNVWKTAVAFFSLPKSLNKFYF